MKPTFAELPAVPPAVKEKPETQAETIESLKATVRVLSASIRELKDDNSRVRYPDTSGK